MKKGRYGWRMPIYICVCVCVCVCVCDIYDRVKYFSEFLFTIFKVLQRRGVKISKFRNSSIVLRKRIFFPHNKSGGYVKPLFAHVFFSNVFSLSLVLLLE